MMQIEPLEVDLPELDIGRVFAALAEPSRRRVITELLAAPVGTERACGSFELPVAKATRTHHFRILREAGLITQRDHGNGSAITLRRDVIDAELPGLLALLRP